jgi:predicted CXXCH cytochrome family protein
LYASYKDHIQFFIVYIREAHPNLLKEGNITGIVGRPKNFDERIILATECVTKYKFSIPMLIDGMDGKVNSDYRAAPVRVTVTDIDGKVAFYGGPGPRDFRLGPVERTLKKLISNAGHMPPPPVPQFSEPVNGLRCGISFDPEKLVVGEQVAVQLKFENTTDRPINFYHRSADVIKQLVINNGNGQTLKVEASGADRWSGMRKTQPARPRGGGGGASIQKIAPGQALDTEIEGKITAGSNPAAFAAGRFYAVYNLEVDDETLAQIEPVPTQPVWTGRLSSGRCTLDIISAQPTSCIDCHGDEDYHHKESQDCESCHIGEVGSENFDVKKESCAQCHPRDGVYGRRQILGPGGEFDKASKHMSGEIEDKLCLLCHDNERHRSGVVSLTNPDSGGTKPWTGTRTEFCLTCHDGEPPADVSFPAKAAGSGYDKSEFRGSAHVQGEQGCSLCHNPHGSAYPSLLTDVHNR